MLDDLSKQVSNWSESVAQTVSRRRFMHKSVKGAFATVAGVTLGSLIGVKETKGMTLTTPYGIDCYNNPGIDSTGHFVDPTGARFLSDAAKAGYQWWRWILDWSNVEISRNSYDWDHTNIDAMVQAVNQAGLKLLIAVDKAPEWRKSPACGNYTLMTPDAAATFVQKMLNHYNAGGYGHIDAIEMGNEAFDRGYNTCPTGDVAAAVMKACYPAIKSVDSTVLVGSPAVYMSSNLTPWWWGSFYGAGGGPYIDWMSIHYYPSPYGPDQVRDAPDQKFMDGIDLVISTAQSYGFSKPIWVTENAWAVSSSVTEAEQSSFYQEILDDSRTSNTLSQQKVAKHFWFDMGSITTNNGNTFRPAYDMVKSYIAQYPSW